MIARNEAHPKVLDTIVRRWSPRAFDGSEMPQEDLDVIFEAAGWAPSSFNVQPWRFCYARRGDANWDRFLSLLIEFNQSWAKDASVIVFAISDRFSRKGEGAEQTVRDNRSHSFDTGAAWQNLALQATALGYQAHGMNGVDFERAADELGVPEDFRVEIGLVIGRQAPKETLPEALQEREEPSGRAPVSDFAFAGNFRG